MKTAGTIWGSGFIGSYITRKFLAEGYEVKVSVTDMDKSEKYQHLFDLKNSDKLNIRGLKIDDIDTLQDFIKYCEIVLHSGTPFQPDVKDPQKDLLDPTIKGTDSIGTGLEYRFSCAGRPWGVRKRYTKRSRKLIFMIS